MKSKWINWAVTIEGDHLSNLSRTQARWAVEKHLRWGGDISDVCVQWHGDEIRPHTLTIGDFVYVSLVGPDMLPTKVGKP